MDYNDIILDEISDELKKRGIDSHYGVGYNHSDLYVPIIEDDKEACIVAYNYEKAAIEF